MDHLCYLCNVYVMPEGKGLTSWLLFVMCIVILSLWYPGTGVVLDCIDC